MMSPFDPLSETMGLTGGGGGGAGATSDGCDMMADGRASTSTLVVVDQGLFVVARGCSSVRGAGPLGAGAACEAEAKAIASGKYDLVLAATGFASHATDRALREASRKAAVPYSRVFKGRPSSVLRALQRDMAPGELSSPPPG